MPFFNAEYMKKKTEKKKRELLSCYDPFLLIDHVWFDRDVSLGGDWGPCCGAFSSSFRHGRGTSWYLSGTSSSRATSVLREGQAKGTKGGSPWVSSPSVNYLHGRSWRIVS